MIKAQKQSKIIPIILVICGILFILGAFYFLINGIVNYKEQLSQKEWIITTAEVTSVNTRIKSGTPGSHRHRTVYDIDYRYEVDSQIYSCTIYGNVNKKEYGEIFKIKYNPLSPQESTHRLGPNKGFITTGVIAFIVCGIIGYRMISICFHKLPKWKKQ